MTSPLSYVDPTFIFKRQRELFQELNKLMPGIRSNAIPWVRIFFSYDKSNDSSNWVTIIVTLSHRNNGIYKVDYIIHDPRGQFDMLNRRQFEDMFKSGLENFQLVYLRRLGFGVRRQAMNNLDSNAVIFCDDFTQLLAISNFNPNPNKTDKLLNHPVYPPGTPFPPSEIHEMRVRQNIEKPFFNYKDIDDNDEVYAWQDCDLINKNCKPSCGWLQTLIKILGRFCFGYYDDDDNDPYTTNVSYRPRAKTLGSILWLLLNIGSQSLTLLSLLFSVIDDVVSDDSERCNNTDNSTCDGIFSVQVTFMFLSIIADLVLLAVKYLSLTVSRNGVHYKDKEINYKGLNCCGNNAFYNNCCNLSLFDFFLGGIGIGGGLILAFIGLGIGVGIEQQTLGGKLVRAIAAPFSQLFYIASVQIMSQEIEENVSNGGLSFTRGLFNCCTHTARCCNLDTKVDDVLGPCYTV